MSELTDAIDEIEATTQAIAEAVDFPDHTTKWAVRIARDAYLEQPVNKSPRTIAASAVYLAGLLDNEKRTQQQVSEASGVSVAPIRTCYREIAEARDIPINTDGTASTDELGATASRGSLTDRIPTATALALGLALVISAAVSVPLGNPVSVGMGVTLIGFVIADRVLAKVYTGSWVGTLDDAGGDSA